MHKLWLARQRPVSEQAKARKDRRQAAAMLEVLLEDRPEELRAAWRAIGERPRDAKAMRAALDAAAEIESVAHVRALLRLA